MAPKPIRLHLMHASLQFSDSREQQRADITRILNRAKSREVAWLTGTEAAASASGNSNHELLEDLAPKFGYRYARRGGDSWVAVSKDWVDGGWDVYSEQIVPGEAGDHSAKSVFAVSFMSERLGAEVTVMAGHYLTRGRPESKVAAQRVNAKINTAYARGIGEYAKKKGKGAALVFYGGDQNIVDRTDDTFMGEPLTTAWDELKKWENTGHGNIDVIASYDHDRRVSAAYCRALDDKEFPLHTDHFLVEAGFDVLPLG